MAEAIDPKGKDLLRSRAERQLGGSAADLSDFSREEIQRAVHELRVHQIELEMQNEDLRSTQMELELARERYVDLYDFAPVGYLTLNPKGIIVDANLTVVSLLGVARSRLIGMGLSRFVLAEDQDKYHTCWRSVSAATKQEEACEVRMCPSGQPVFFARLQLVAVEQAGARLCRLTISNITEQKVADEALRQGEKRKIEADKDQRVRLALEAGDLGAWDQDLRTGVITCSERARTMLYFPAGMPVTWDALLARLHPDDRPMFRKQLERSAESIEEPPLELIFRIVLPNGSERWLRFVSRCLFHEGAERRPIRRTGVLADITRQKEAEEMLHSRAKQLEGLVRERTTRLEEAVAELEHFSYTLAHDLRAPLRAIRGYSELLVAEASGLNPMHKEFLERTNFAAARMDQLIMDALNYNKLVRQHFPLEQVDADVVLEQLLQSYPEFQEARAYITVVDRLPLILGNAALLAQCFSNLLHNGLKFMPPGRTPRLRIWSQDAGKRVRIWFEDNGIGIPQDCLEKIFRMFERLDDSYEGTGIGLPLVRKAAERMGGAVGVESILGEGSRFWLELQKPEPPAAP